MMKNRKGWFKVEAEEVAAHSTLRERGQVTIPAAVRETLGIDTGDQVEFAVDASGAVTLRGYKLVPADQAWFWSDSWQRGEREASDDIAAGRSEVFNDGAEFLEAVKG